MTPDFLLMDAESWNGRSERGANGTPEGAGTKAVILAGGRGTRLAPYTSVLPKPLMPIGDRSILEIVVDQLAEHDITDVTFCVGYLSHLIRAVFDHRRNGSLEIKYVEEEEALGTAGPIRLIEGLDRTFLAMNGDVLTTLDYADFIQSHRESVNILTIATHQRTVKIDYGVLHTSPLESETGRVVAYEEKPEITSTVSMGIYALEPEVLQYIPDAMYFDIPDLVQELLCVGEVVGSYLYDGLWFDIGRQDDYELAATAWGNNGSNGTNGNGAHRVDGAVARV
jgi:NDP-sugar pyrophosphorylase family protein